MSGLIASNISAVTSPRLGQNSFGREHLQLVTSQPSQACQLIVKDWRHNLADVFDQLRADPQQLVLVFYRNLQESIAEGLEAGQTPGMSLGLWLAETEKLLDFFSKFRKRTILVDARAARLQPGQLRQTIAARLKTSESLRFDEPPAPVVSSLAEFLAQQFLQQQSDLVAKLQYLEACSLPLDITLDEIPTEKLTEAFVAQRQSLSATENKLKSLVKLELEQKNLSQENELLLKQLHIVQEELERYYLKMSQQEEAHKKLLAKETSELKSRLENQNKSHAKETSELKSTLENLKKSAKEAYDKQNAQIKDLTSQLEQLKAAKAQASASRISSAPNETALNELKNENELLLKQLHIVQEELERYYLQSKDLKETSATQISALKSQLDEANQKYRKVTGDYIALKEKQLVQKQDLKSLSSLVLKFGSIRIGIGRRKNKKRTNEALLPAPSYPTTLARGRRLEWKYPLLAATDYLVQLKNNLSREYKENTLLMSFRFFNQATELHPREVVGLSRSDTVGFYKYLPHPSEFDQTSTFKFTAPSNCDYVAVSLVVWNGQPNVDIFSEPEFKPLKPRAEKTLDMMQLRV